MVPVRKALQLPGGRIRWEANGSFPGRLNPVSMAGVSMKNSAREYRRGPASSTHEGSARKVFCASSQGFTQGFYGLGERIELVIRLRLGHLSDKPESLFLAHLPLPRGLSEVEHKSTRVVVD